MANFATVANDTTIARTQAALEANGFKVTVVNDGKAASQAALRLIPKGAEVMTMTSKTLEALGLDTLFNESGDYDAVRPKFLAAFGDPAKKDVVRKLGVAPAYAIGSVHAITQDGHALIASGTGSQLPAYLYGAGSVVWVVGAQKIVSDLQEASDRLRQHVFPLEDARLKEVYGAGVQGSINKEVAYHKEPAGRVHIIIVKEPLGF